MNIPSILSPDGRRAWAFASILGGSMMMTIFAWVVLYIVRDSKGLAFWMGMAAMAIIFTCITGLIAMFVKRTISVTRDGVSVTDGDTVLIEKGESK